MKQELEVTSPTYTIVERYELPNRPKVCHMDFYRLDKNSNLDDLDLYDAFENYLCIIEWPDKLIHALPEESTNNFGSFCAKKIISHLDLIDHMIIFWV